MSTLAWDTELSLTLTRLTNARAPEQPRIAIVGIGQVLRGDDGAANVIVERLRTLLPPGGAVLALDGGPAPENQTGRLRHFRADLVVLVDAAQVDMEPGSLCWLPWRTTTGVSASTHTLPPHMLAQFLMATLNCEVCLIGIQPGNTDLGARLSHAVDQAVESATARLADILLPYAVVPIHQASPNNSPFA